MLKANKSLIFFLRMHKLGMRLICIHVTIQNMGFSNQTNNLHNFQLFLYLFKVLHKQASEFSSRLE